MKVGYTTEALSIEFNDGYMRRKVMYDDYTKYFRAVQKFDVIFTARFSEEWFILANRALQNGYTLCTSTDEVEQLDKAIYISPSRIFIAIKSERSTIVYDEKEIESYAR